MILNTYNRMRIITSANLKNRKLCCIKKQLCFHCSLVWIFPNLEVKTT